MSDVFREVDEDLRREQLQKLWDRFAPYVIGLAVLIVLGVAGYKGWEYWQTRQAEASSDRFIAALDLAAAGKMADSIAALQALTKDGSGSYPVLARFLIASEKADSGDKTGAVADYDAIAGQAGLADDIKTMARLRAAYLLVDTASVADLTKRVGDLAATGSAWRGSAREVLALAAYGSGDFQTAKMYFDQLQADLEIPSDIRDRANVMATLVNSRLALAGAAPALTVSGPGVAPAVTVPAPAPAPAAVVPAPAASAATPAPPPTDPAAPPTKPEG